MYGEITQDVVYVLRKNANQLSESASSIECSINRLIIFIDEYSAVLSSHQEKLYEDLRGIKTVLNENAESIETVANIIYEMADRYELILRTINYRD